MQVVSLRSRCCYTSFTLKSKCPETEITHLVHLLSGHSSQLSSAIRESAAVVPSPPRSTASPAYHAIPTLSYCLQRSLDMQVSRLFLFCSLTVELLELFPPCFPGRSFIGNCGNVYYFVTFKIQGGVQASVSWRFLPSTVFGAVFISPVKIETFYIQTMQFP